METLCIVLWLTWRSMCANPWDIEHISPAGLMLLQLLWLMKQGTSLTGTTNFLICFQSWVEPTPTSPLHIHYTHSVMCSTVEWRHHTLSQPGDIPLQLKCHVGGSLPRSPKRQAVVVTQQRRLHTTNCVNKDRSNTHRRPETTRCRVTQNAPLPPSWIRWHAER